MGMLDSVTMQMRDVDGDGDGDGKDWIPVE